MCNAHVRRGYVCYVWVAPEKVAQPYPTYQEIYPNPAPLVAMHAEAKEAFAAGDFERAAELFGTLIEQAADTQHRLQQQRYQRGYEQEQGVLIDRARRGQPGMLLR